MTSKSNRDKLWGLCLTAAMEINHHPEIGVVLGGSESGRDVVEMMRLLIFNTIVDGMGFVELPTPAPLVIGLEPLDIQCICGHRYRDHFQDGTCHECKCGKFDSGGTGESPEEPDCQCGHAYNLHTASIGCTVNSCDCARYWEP